MCVSGGSLSDDQVVRQLRRLVPGDIRWTPILLEENVFKVDFPKKEDLTRLTVFGIFKVPDSPLFAAVRGVV